MKIIMLDIDGVLNSHEYLKEANRADAIDPVMVARLNRLIGETGAKVVLSSTWRIFFGIERVVNQYLIPAGFKGDIIDETPSLQIGWNGRSVPRGTEIQEWLNDHPEVTDFVILDDEADMEHLLPQLVQTSFVGKRAGLQEKHVEMAKKILGE